MMRVSTRLAFDRAVDAMSQRQARMSDLQTRLATGRKALSPSDDPVAVAQAESARSSVTRIEIEKRMVGFARTMMRQAEGALGTGTELVLAARDLALQGANATLSADDRALIAKQLRGMRDELLSVANRRDGSGAYVFGGHGMRTAPFGEAAGQVVYSGDAGTQQVGTDLPFSTALDGRSLFMSAAGGGAPRSVFDSFDSLIAAYENPAASADQAAAASRLAIDDFDATLDALNLGRADAGEQLRAIDSIENALESGEIEARTRLSDLVDLDFAQAISDFSREQTGLDAAMRTYAQISQLSLFNYIR